LIEKNFSLARVCSLVRIYNPGPNCLGFVIPVQEIISEYSLRFRGLQIHFSLGRGLQIPTNGGQGAYADLLLVDGSPIKNIKLVEDPEKNFLIIMKDGVIYKNIIQQ
jgi:hypothetical protein